MCTSISTYCLIEIAARGALSHWPLLVSPIGKLHQCGTVCKELIDVGVNFSGVVMEMV